MIRCWEKPCDNNKTIILAQLEGNVHELMAAVPIHESESEILNSITAENRRKEFLTVRYLLNQHFGSPIRILHDKNGKPFLPDRPEEISITHSGNFIGVLIGNTASGIDLEKNDRPVEKIIPKFLNQEEQSFLKPSDKNRHALICWTMKEVIVKKYNQPHIDFRAGIRISSFMPNENGKTMVEIKTPELITSDIVHWFTLENHIISYSI